MDINLLDLKNLLDADKHSSDEDDQPINSLGAKLGPGSIGPKKKSSQKSVPNVYEKKVTKDIWDENEVEEGAEFDTSDDPRQQPEYEIIYKQRVTTEEIFLQMGTKSPATSSCEDMIVRVQLPGVQSLTEIDLNLHEKFMDCRTANYRLGLHLPHPVDTSSSNAKWDSATSSLSVTMRMNRELDFVNF